MFRSIQTKFAHHALNTIGVFTQSDAQNDTFAVVILNEVKDLILKLNHHLESAILDKIAKLAIMVLAILEVRSCRH